MRIRKLFSFVEDTLIEGGHDADRPLRKVAVVAVVANPVAGHWRQDLSELIDASPEIARQISARAIQAMDGQPIESYGKAAVVGTAGEQEHAVAMLTTVYGNVLRDAVGGGKAWISSVTKRGGPGTTLDVPLAHKDALFVRSHYDAMTITVHDAPLPEEIAIVCCFASRGRLHHRVGGLAVNEIKGIDGLR